MTQHPELEGWERSEFTAADMTYPTYRRGSGPGVIVVHEIPGITPLVERFADVKGLESAFMALTPGRQRGLVLNIEGAKQSKTRSDRVVKHIPRILAGKGIHDCICGKSQRMPRCDGSHSQ